MKKSQGPYVLLLTPRCHHCGRPLLGFGTPEGARCPIVFAGGACKPKPVRPS